MNSKRNLKARGEFEIHPSAEELAEVFWAMDAEEQSGFFNTLAEISDGRLPFQLQNVTDSPHLTDRGRAAMVLVGDYGGAQPDRAEEHWLVAHDDRCDNTHRCVSFGGSGRCYYTRNGGMSE